MNGSRSLGEKSLGNELLELLQLPDDISTVITADEGSLSKVLGHERMSRITGEMQIKIALAKIAYATEYAGDHRDRMDERLAGHIAKCDKIQAGETPFGCAHLEDMRGQFWRFVAISFTLPIVIALIIAAIMRALT